MTASSKNSGLIKGTSSDVTFLAFKYLEIVSLPPSSKPFDLSQNITRMSYFENILEASVTMEIEVASSTSVFNTVNIRGGETVMMEVETAQGSFEFDEDNPLYVYKVSDMSTTLMGETLVLHLVSREYLTNETSRCLKKYGEQTIHEHVKAILRDELSTNRFSDSTIDSTVNTYTFIGNNKKPFHTLHWLGPKGVSSEPGPKGNSGGEATGEALGTAGFLFFENKDGFNFRSLDRLVSKTSSGSSSANGIYEYVYTDVIEEGVTKNTQHKILKYFYEHNLDLRKSLRVGLYCNYTYFYDSVTSQLSGFKYEINKQLRSKLGEEDTHSTHFDGAISRVMFRISDHGTLDPGGDKKDSGRDAVDMAKSYSRYNLLFSQALNILVPLNVNLKVGDIIKCKLPLKGSDPDGDSGYDKDLSGNYLIRELRHTFTANQNTTSLKLMRDSYGLY